MTAPAEEFEALAQQLVQDYPKHTVRRGVRAELRVDQGKLVPPTAEDLGFQGVFLHAADETVIVQFRPDGFTFNNVSRYMGGDALLTASLNVWTRFAEALRPTSVSRIALKYVNQPKLPFQPGDDFGKYLTAAPTTPDGAPQTVSEFLSRVVANEDDWATVITTQQLTAVDSPPPQVVIDIDAFCVGQFPVDIVGLRTVLDRLRQVKNRTFFAHLTDAAVELFR